jgi:enoyl-CoA hydratase
MTVHLQTSGPVATITVDRPEVKNAIDGPTAAALAEAFRAFEADATLHAAVLCGAGGTFCSGADLKAVATGQNALRADPEGDAPLGPTRMWLSKPVIAAVSGYAVAGGLELALLCDLRVVERSAVFGAFERRWGVPLVDGGTVRLPRLIGLSRALDLILTGRPVGAEEALAIGLANRVVEDGTARAEAEALAHAIAAFPQTCLRNDRQSAYEQFGLPLAAALRNEFTLGLATLGSGETVAGASEFAAGKGRHGKPR